MSVQQNRNIQYSYNFDTWKMCRDAAGGEASVKAAGETYLPRIGNQTDDQYANYKLRARFYNAFIKTIKGHTGLATRKAVVLTHGAPMKEISDNIDRKGSDVRSYIRNTLEEILTTGRCGTLVDYTKVDTEATMADTEGDRPYWARYDAEHILDWEFVDNELVYVVLREYVAQRGMAMVTGQNFRYRVLEMKDGVYIQTVYMGDETEGEVLTPMLGGQSLSFIPFIFHQTEFSEDVVPPPLIDLVNLCMSHYRLKADHMHALHYVALPTPWATGVTDDDSPTTIGPETMWNIANEGARVGMLEFSGQGVGAIKEELESQEEQMAILGARVLLPEMSEKTATASNLRSMSETSDLASMVMVLVRQINRLYDFTALWAGDNSEAEVEMDTNFLPKEMDAGMLTALIGGWQTGAYDRDVLNDNLLRAEIIDAEKDLDEMITNIESEDEERMTKAAKAIADATQASVVPGEEEEEDEEEEEKDG